jgi:hypothetical protein
MLAGGFTSFVISRSDFARVYAEEYRGARTLYSQTLSPTVERGAGENRVRHRDRVLGAALARMEARIALEDFLHRVPQFSSAATQPRSPGRALHLHGPTNLPLRVEVAHGCPTATKPNINERRSPCNTGLRQEGHP